MMNIIDETQQYLCIEDMKDFIGEVQNKKNGRWHQKARPDQIDITEQ